MSTENSFQNTDKFERHYRQQLSALIDGELSPDESRFLLRRLEHDVELSACHERWQLCGDVLRGNASVLAPAGFAERVRAAVEAEPAPGQAAAQRRGSWARWGGGAALAASVAAVALFMSRQQLPDASTSAEPPIQVVASAAKVPDAPPKDPDGALVEAMAAVPAAALASRRQEAARRAGATTRTQQASRIEAGRGEEPQRMVAGAEPAPLAPASPFAATPTPLHAKPWPRSIISTSGVQGAFNASLSSEEGAATFYPFEPSLPQVEPSPADQPQD